MKIAFFIPNMSSGGAERVTSLLCNEWCKHHSVHLITQTNSQSHYSLDLKIQKHFLHTSNKPNKNILQRVYFFLYSLIKLRNYLKKTKPDIMISFLYESNILSSLACFKLPLKLVISERTHPGHYISPQIKSLLQPLSKVLKKDLACLFNRYSRKWTYRKANAVVVQNTSVQNWFRHTLNLETIIIENPINLIHFDPKPTPNNQTIISIGRFSEEKNHQSLINAFLSISNQFPTWTLELYGDGILKNQLIQSISSHPNQHQVKFMGITHSTHQTLKKADLFVLPSKIEGFPNVLLEALASGCATVCTSFPGLPEKLQPYIRTCKSTSDDMASVLSLLMNDPALRHNLKVTAEESVQCFDIKKNASIWIETFNRI